MAGKNTFLHGQHESRSAKMVSPIQLSDDEWSTLEKIIAENKVKDEFENLRKVYSDKTTSDDQKSEIARKLDRLKLKCLFILNGDELTEEEFNKKFNKVIKPFEKEVDQIKQEIQINHISSDLRSQINDRLSTIAHYRKEYFYTSVNLQDIKRSLSAIKSLSAFEALEAFKNLDASSVAYIDAQIWKKHRVFADWIVNMQFVEFTEAGDPDLRRISLKRLAAQNFAGEAIIEAAEIALKDLPDSTGGKPMQSHNEDIAKLAIRIWDELGCQGKAYATEGEGSPLTSFATIFFNKINGSSNASGTSKIIRKLISNRR